MTARSFAFLGSGEFEPWHDDIDRWLLDRSDGDGSVLVLPTASAPEGDEVFDRWGSKGLDHYARLGVPASVIPLKTADDAARPDLLEQVERASVIFFSGGNPSYLARVLDGSPFWDRMCSRLDDGLAYAGCSAGVACLTDMTYDSDTQELDAVWQRGLGFVGGGALFGPHWDIVDSWVPGARDFITASTPQGGVLVGLDEDTAMVGDGASWTVHGRQRVHVYRDRAWTTHEPGARFDLTLLVSS
jgi:cyanophycinase